MFVLPSQDSKRFVQPNLGDTQGNLWSTFGIDATHNPGKIQTKRSLMSFEVNYFAGTGVTIATPTAYAYYDVTGDGVLDFVTYAGQPYYSTSPVTAPASAFASQPTTTGNTGNGDLKVFNGKMYCTTNTGLYHSTNFTWSSLSTGFTSAPHPMDTYGDKLYIADKNKVYSVDTSNVLSTSGSATLDLSFFTGHISWIRAGSNRIWIGFTKSDGGKGLIFEWDGESENIWSRNYLIDAQGSSGCALYNDIPYVMDVEGRLLAFNGSGFIEVARLPILQEDCFAETYILQQGHKITHFNGLIFSNDRLLINVCSNVITTSGGTILENFPSGVWEYTKETGLVHLMSPSRTPYSSGASPTDYGMFKVINAGAIYDATTTLSTTPSFLATIAFGAGFTNTSEASSSRYATFVDDVRGYKSSSYMITSWLDSSNVTDVWNKVILKYRKLQNENDKVSIKYRTYKKTFVPVLGTYTSTTTLTVNASGYPAIADVEVGDEMQVTLGGGAGQCVHVTSIVADTNYTITVDTPIIGAVSTKTCEVIFQNWRKLIDITQDDFQYKSQQIPNLNKDVNAQFKIVMEWEGGNELNGVIVVNDTEQFAK